jgi:hypothetical protein
MTDDTERWMVQAVLMHAYGGPVPDGAVLHGMEPVDLGKRRND